MLELLRPVRGGLAGMSALTFAGSVVGLAVPVGLGALVDDLAAGRRGHAALWAAATAGAVLLAAVLFALSDGLYARQTARLLRHLRLLMFEGVLRGGAAGSSDPGGLASRFVSDVEALEDMTVAVLDAGVVALAELGAGLAVLAVLDPWTVVVCAAVAAAAAARSQRRLPALGEERQAALEHMSRVLAAREREPFARALDRVVRSETRLGWLRAANQHGSAALAGLGPLAVVAVAAFAGGGVRAGTLLTLYLLAERVFSGAESLLDLRLDVELVRGVVGRCLQLASA